MLKETIKSENLSETRALTVCVPPLDRGQQIAAVVYLADGADVTSMAPFVEPLIVSRRLPPILLLGINNGGVLPGSYSPANDMRSLEYLQGVGEYIGKGDARFEAHERFVLSEVLPWAEAKFGTPKTAERRAVFGVSNGGSFALAMGLRHPDIFRHVISFSAGWEKNLKTPTWSARQAPSHYLLVGALERPSTLKLVQGWAASARSKGAAVTLVEPVAGHDEVMWREWFPAALLNQFGVKNPSKRIRR